ncbi:Calcium/proton exchanger [Mycena sanguinolenta]|uniref:Calcium/proton exchanger n=1 Tax=Mycena sanguinolenta TaxID=230812 RepID=A0A8H6XZJ4_9AGAR|nr:Calcium/proton exchanger [Mycena sanguinolenta]
MADFSTIRRPPTRSPSTSVESNSDANTLKARIPNRRPTIEMEEARVATPDSAVDPQSRFQSKTAFYLKKIFTLPKSCRPSGSLLKPAKELGPVPGIAVSLRVILLSKWNLMLLCMPVCWVLHFVTPNQYAAIFFMGFFAIVPLAKLLAFATDELSLRVGQALAGLINATLGNVVELIVAIIALKKLIGSVLSNLLLVLGMCFLLGGLKFSEQGFAAGAAQLNSSLLTVSVIAVLLPAAYRMSQNADNTVVTAAEDPTQGDILKFSHGLAIILLCIYVCYLFFQLGSHTKMYQDDSIDIVKSTVYEPKQSREDSSIELKNLGIDGAAQSEEPKSIEEDGFENPQLNGWVCLGLLLTVTVLVAVTAEFVVDSINGLTTSTPLTKEFVGIILLPIVGNAAEHVSAVYGARKDKLTLSMGVAVGSSIQISLFVIPFTVVIAWMMGKPLTMLFDPYEAICLFLAVLTVNYVVQDGKSNWLEGAILMSLYVILGLLFWFYPGIPSADHFSVCT